MTATPNPAAIRQAKQRKQRAKLMLALVVFVSVSFGLALKFTHGANGKSEEALEGVETAIARREKLFQKISATGVVAAQTGAQVRIGAQLTGRIKRLSADVGSVVTAGQVIAELDLPDVHAELEQAERGFDRAKAVYEQEAAGLSLERIAVNTDLKLATEALASAQVKLRQTVEIARNAPNETAAEIRRADEALRASESRVKQAQTDARLQPLQTRANIQKAEAGLSTARSTLNQVEKSANLQVADAEANRKQARAQLANAVANHKRVQDLVKREFASQKDLDNALTAEAVAEAGVESAQEKLKLVKEKVAADLQAAKDGVTQATAQLDEARNNRLLDELKYEEVRNAEALLRQAGAALAAVRASVYQDEVKRQEVTAVESQVRQAEGKLSSARANLEKVGVKEKQIAAAREAMHEAQARIAIARAKWDKTFIRTPIGGTVLQLAQQEGETVAAGLSAPTLIEVADLARLEDNAYVDETDIARVKLGMRCEIIVDSFPNQPFKGRVKKINSGMTMQQNVVTYMTTVELDDPGGKLKPGMTTTTTIFIGETPEVVTVPSEAVKKTKDGALVFVWKQGMEKPDKRKVKIGATDGMNVEIAEGIKPGESVVLAGLDKLGVEGFTQATPSFFQRMANPFAGGGEGKGKRP